jgi:hypothetical protein
MRGMKQNGDDERRALFWFLLLAARGGRRDDSARTHVANDVAVNFVVVDGDVHKGVRHLRGGRNLRIV